MSRNFSCTFGGGKASCHHTGNDIATYTAPDNIPTDDVPIHDAPSVNAPPSYNTPPDNAPTVNVPPVNVLSVPVPSVPVPVPKYPVSYKIPSDNVPSDNIQETSNKPQINDYMPNHNPVQYNHPTHFDGSFRSDTRNKMIRYFFYMAMGVGIAGMTLSMFITYFTKREYRPSNASRRKKYDIENILVSSPENEDSDRYNDHGYL